MSYSTGSNETIFFKAPKFSHFNKTSKEALEANRVVILVWLRTNGIVSTPNVS